MQLNGGSYWLSLTLIYGLYHVGISMPEDIGEFLATIQREFPVDLNSTEPVELEEGGFKLLRVYPSTSPLIHRGVDVGTPYILDTKEGRQIACHPHVVGVELERLALGAAKMFRRTLEGLDLLEPNETALLHILRGSAGYRVAEALPDGIPIARVRTEYMENGYRSHSDDGRQINVTFVDIPRGLGSREAKTLIIPDTFATGRSVEAAINEMFDLGIRPERVILYGFIAIPGLQRMGALSSERGIQLYSFSICDLSQLAWNNYDMPMYGPDESLFTAKGKLKKLGSIIDIETLREILPHYVAGLDQPGDWSERQSRLFNGYGDESGNIVGHLEKSIELIESLREISSMTQVGNQLLKRAAKIELRRLRDILKQHTEYGTNL
jgi:uracil phosphoribosyltransferase